MNQTAPPNEMVGRRVFQRGYPDCQGTVTKWTPLTAALCDVLIKFDKPNQYGHSECWFASTEVLPVDSAKPLPNRKTVIEENRQKTISQLKDIRQQFIEEDFRKPWPGMEFGKSHLGNAISAAIEQLDYIDPVHSAASTLGRLGGQAKSPAKSTSSRENGRKGGRPKKVVAEETVNESNLDLFT